MNKNPVNSIRSTKKSSPRNIGALPATTAAD